MTYLEQLLLERLEKLEVRVNELEKKLGENIVDSNGEIDPVKKQVLNDISEGIERTKLFKDNLRVLRTEVLSGAYDLSDKWQIRKIYNTIEIYGKGWK